MLTVHQADMFLNYNSKYHFWCITICFIKQHSPPYCASWACTTTKSFVVHHEDCNNKNQPFLNYPSNSLSWNFSSKISNLWQDHIYFFNIKLNSNRQPGHSYVHMTLWRKKGSIAVLRFETQPSYKIIEKTAKSMFCTTFDSMMRTWVQTGLFWSLFTAGQRERDVNK